MSELATTYVRIRPRTAGFKTEADAQLKREKPSDQTVQVSADTRPAEERLSLLSSRLDTLRLRTTEARVRLAGDDRALGRLAQIDAAMIRLDRARANPKIDLEGVAKAEAQLAALNAQIDRLDRRGGGAGGGLLGRAAGFGRGGFFGGLGLLGVAGGAAAVPLGVGAAGLGASFLTPATAGTAGLGFFGAASASAFKRVNKAQTQLDALDKRIANTSASTTTAGASPAAIAAAQARLQAAQERLAAARANPTASVTSLTSARAGVLSAQSSLGALESRGGTKANPAYDRLIKQRQQLLKQMTPAERDAADGIEKLEHSWVHFQRALEPQSFNLLATGTDIFRKGLHDLLPMTKAVGDEVDDLAKRAEKALDSPFWQHFFHDFLTVEAPRAVDSLFSSIGHVVTGLAHLAEQWTPLGHSLEDSLVSVTQRFEDWSSGSGPAKFIAIVRRDGPIAAHAISALASAIGGVARGLEPIGRIELQALAPVLEFIGKLGEQHPQVITALGIAYLTVAGGLKAIAAVDRVSEALGGTTAGLGRLRKGALLTAGAIGTVEIGKHASSATSATLGGALTGLAAGFLAFGPEGAVVGAIVGGLAALDVHFISSQGHVESFTATVDALGQSLVNAVQADNGLLGSNVKRQVKQQLLTNPEFQKAGKYGHTLLETLAKYGVTVDDLISRAQGGYPASYKRMIDAALKSGNKELINQVDDLILGIQQALRDAKAIGLVSGSSGTSANFSAGAAEHGGGGAGGGHGHGGGGGLGSANLGQQGVSGGQNYVTGVAAGITASIPKAEVAVERLSNRLAAKLKAAQARETQLASSITSALLGELGIGALGAMTDAYGNPLHSATGATGIIAGLTDQEHALKQFRHRLRFERHHGLSAKAEEEIAGLGLAQGGAIAESLMGATPAQRRRISRLEAHLQALAHDTGSGIAHDVFGQRVDEMTQVLRHIHRILVHGTGRHKTLTEADYQKLRQLLEDALHGNPVVFDTGKHSRKSARGVRTS